MYASAKASSTLAEAATARPDSLRLGSLRFTKTLNKYMDRKQGQHRDGVLEAVETFSAKSKDDSPVFMFPFLSFVSLPSMRFWPRWKI